MRLNLVSLVKVHLVRFLDWVLWTVWIRGILFRVCNSCLSWIFCTTSTFPWPSGWLRSQSARLLHATCTSLRLPSRIDSIMSLLQSFHPGLPTHQILDNNIFLTSCRIFFESRIGRTFWLDRLPLLLLLLRSGPRDYSSLTMIILHLLFELFRTLWKITLVSYFLCWGRISVRPT